jgi:hypothetical protein
LRSGTVKTVAFAAPVKPIALEVAIDLGGRRFFL